jgi:mutual gliding-motility protein MglA
MPSPPQPNNCAVPTIDYTSREVVFRVAACGPAGAGKTTLLWRLHAQMPPVERGEMTIRPIGADQLVAFECSAPDLVPMGEYRARLQLFTVPGRISDPAIWARVMGDVDGVLFVADSQFERMGENGDALRELAALPGCASAPVVFIYNKRDLPNCAPLDYIDVVINKAEPRAPRFEGLLVSGAGAKEALAALSRLMLEKASSPDEDESPSSPKDPAPEPAVPAKSAAPQPASAAGQKPSALSMEGGCACGAIRYRLLGLPRDVFYSHDAVQRRAHGAPVVAWVACAPPDFVLTAGRLKEFGENKTTRAFCPVCGSPLTFRDLDSELLQVAAATLDHPELLTPLRHECAAQSLPWLKISDGLPRTL